MIDKNLRNRIKKYLKSNEGCIDRECEYLLEESVETIEASMSLVETLKKLFREILKRWGNE
jgi:hypothetical protein